MALENNDLLIPSWPAPANVMACTTLRNLDANYFNQLPAQPAWLKQVHGINVVQAEKIITARPEADASFSVAANTVCAVVTADCLPILLCDRSGTQIAAIHAGWRGLCSGIIAETTKKFTTPLEQCLAWIGPAISTQVFEVGSDVPEAFLVQGWDKVQIAHAFKAKPNVSGKFLGDLVYLARHALQQQGIPASSIYGGEWCTYSDPVRFHSYRRSPTDLGRMASLIWLK